MRKKSVGGTNESHKTIRQVAYQRGNQKEGSPHYVFLYSDDESEDEEVYPLKTRNANQHSTPRKVEVINIQIQSEDTLQAIALRYCCTISELKRINKIHNDNEIHARPFIKIPVQAYSLLMETIENSKSESNNDGTVVGETSVQTDNNASNDNQLIVIPPSTSSTIEINSIILNSTVEPLSQFNNEFSHGIEDAETDQLISSAEKSRINSSNNIVNTFKCSGADWGLSWFQLLGFSLLLGFAGPIIYVLYIAESSKHHHSS